MKIGWPSSIEDIDHGMETLTWWTLFITALDRGEQVLSSEGFHPAWMQGQGSCIVKRFPLGASSCVKILSSLLWRLPGGLFLDKCMI